MFGKILDYTDSLAYYDKVDYAYIIKLLKMVLPPITPDCTNQCSFRLHKNAKLISMHRSIGKLTTPI